MTDTYTAPDFSDLENPEDLNPANARYSSPPASKVGFGMAAVDTGERYVEKCKKCGGRGRFISWAGRDCGPCFTCKGKGEQSFKNPAHVRERQKAQRAEAKTRKQREASEAYAADHQDVIDWMAEAAPTFQFARSLLEAFTKYGSLTEKQTAAARKCITRRDEKRAEREAAKVQIDLTPIREMFETAKASGYKKPTYRAEGLVINRAPDHGRNPGALYVKNLMDVYGGKVDGTEFQPRREADADDYATYHYEDEDRNQITVSRKAADALAVIAENPEAAAVRYGQQTGNCACCGRELTKRESIDRGIGPICAQKWGF